LKWPDGNCEDARVTVSTRLYSGAMLPQSLAWQALSFLRCEWPFLFTGPNRLRDRPFGDLRTTYVVRIDGEVLLSYAEVLSATGTRAGEPVNILGISNVFTFPPYRREGHASALMAAVGQVIGDSNAEVAILFCENELEPFYAARGWRVAAAGSIQTPGRAPRAMVRPGPARGARPLVGITAAPLKLDMQW
jgi:hypothetical protein